MTMVINHNLPAMNTLGKLQKNSSAMSKSMEKLSSGLRINRAGDDAAGLAISEKMRGQIRGLDVASANAQDATNMLNTAEGALGTTEDILQRMKELATQAANDTYVKSDRGEIQKEINQLTSEINRIANTTEFNTQKLLKGSGEAGLDGISMNGYGNLKGGVDEVLQQGSATLRASGIAAVVGDSVSVTIGGQTLRVEFIAAAGDLENKLAEKAFSVSDDGLSAKVYVSNLNGSSTGAAKQQNAAALRDALGKMIEKNSTLKGNVTVDGTGLDVTLKAVAGGVYDGANAGVNGLTAGATFTMGGALNFGEKTLAAGMTGYVKTAGVKATATVSIVPAWATSASVYAGVAGKGMTINGTAIEFYDGSKGAYQGKVQGVDISQVQNTTGLIEEIIRQVKVDGLTLSLATGAGKLRITADSAGTKGNDLNVQNGTVQGNFEATFQVGANKGQSMTIELGDARAAALGVAGSVGANHTSGAKFTSATTVTDGTNTVLKEASLDVSNHQNATAAIEAIESAIEQVSAERSKIGAYTNRLEYTIDQVTNTSENISNSESRIRDVDMASEMMKYQTKSVNTQAAQAMLAQANQAPQNVLSLLR